MSIAFTPELVGVVAAVAVVAGAVNVVAGFVVVGTMAPTVPPQSDG